MIPQSLDLPAQDNLLEIESAECKNAAVAHDSFLDGWLYDHSDILVSAILVLAFAARIFTATKSYLNPDEALHYFIINQHSVWLAYQNSLTNAHPPLMYLVVYYWHFLGSSEWMLRFPSVLAGTGFCWMVYKWINGLFGRTAGLIALGLASFSPALIALSAELRQYALLLFGIATALYFLERSFQELSAGKILVFSAFLYVAILSHYSAAFVTLGVGIYALARIVDLRPPRKFVIAWACGQVGALAIYVFLYITHISKIKNSFAVWSTSFGTTYFQSGSENIFSFTAENTYNIFQFLFGAQSIALIMLSLFIGAVAVLFGSNLLGRHADSRVDRSGILLLLPFIAVWGASIAGVYPYIGSRHTIFLAPFVIAAVSYGLAAIVKQKLWAGICIAVLLMTFANVAYKPIGEDVWHGDHSPASMKSAVSYMQQTIPAKDYVLADYQSGLALTYYFCGPKIIIPLETINEGNFRFDCNSHPIVFLHLWKLIAHNFPLQFEKMAQSTGLQPGDRVWVFQTGWGASLATDLADHDVKFRCLAPKTFGVAVTIIPFIVGPDFLPLSPSQSCSVP